MEYYVYWLLKVLVLKFLEMKNTAFFWDKKLMEVWYLLTTEKFLFWTFQRWEIRSFFETKSWWKYDIGWLLKVLVLNISEMENTVFFEPKSWWKDDTYGLMKSSCFELFGDWKYDLLFSQKVDRKMILIWSFWGFPDIQGLEKYGFPCDYSLISFILIYDKNQHKKTERNQNNNNKKLSYPNFGLPYQKRVITTATDILRRACYTELKFWVHIFIIDIYLL